MEWIPRWLRRLRLLIRWRMVERSMEDELRYHIECETAERVRSGLSTEEARRAALVDFGGLEQVKEDARDARGGRVLEDLVADTRYGARVLRRNPGFTAAAVLTFALGSGAASAIFSVVYGILLRPLPYADPARLMVLWERSLLHSADRNVVAVGNFEAWRDRSRSFEGMAALVPRPVTVSGGSGPERMAGAEVSPGYFGMLGVAPALGRPFGPEDGRADAPEVAILGDGLWKRTFGSDPGVVGHTLLIDHKPAVIVGVMPAGFEPPRFGWLGAQELWFPFRATPENRAWGRFLLVVARLRPEVSLEQARAEMAGIGAALARDITEDKGWSVSIVPLAAQITGDIRTALIVILGAVGLLLVIAVTNVATLTASLMHRRAQEMATRRALGATDARLRRQWLTQSALLGLTGAGVALFAAAALVRLLVSMAPPDVPRLSSVRIDAPALLLTTAVPMAATIVFGALAASRKRKDGTVSRLAVADGRVSPRGGSTGLVAAEIGVALALSVMAVLMARSFAGLRAVDLGFAADGVVAARVALSANDAPQERTRAAFASLLERVRALPGVQSVGLISTRPFSGLGVATTVRDARPGSSAASSSTVADVRLVNESLFRTLRIPVVRGRTFDANGSDQGPPSVVISESLAAWLWPNEDPIGRQVHLDLYSGIEPEVIGTVPDLHLMDARTPPRPAVYLSDARFPSDVRDLIVRASGDAQAVAPSLRRALAEIDPGAPLYQVTPLPRLVEGAVGADRFTTVLLAGFAAVALLLSGVGVYGVISSDVERRRREIGIRMALGAVPGVVARMLLRQALVRASAGVAGGALLALWLAHSMKSLLFAVAPTDPATFLIVTIAVLGVVTAATLIPAIRAMRSSPLMALREG